MPEQTKRSLFRPSPEVPTGVTLPPTTKLSPFDLAAEALLSPLGLGGNPNDPTKYQLSPEGRISLDRAHATGDMVSMLIPAGGIARNLIKDPALRAELLQKVLTSTPETLKEAVGYFTSRFPRQMSSVKAVEELPRNSILAGNFATPAGIEPQVGTIQVNPRGTVAEQVGTIGHELKHADQAQRLAKASKKGLDTSRFDYNYDQLQDLYGYTAHPMEKEARAAQLLRENRFLMHQREQEGPLLPGMKSPRTIMEWVKSQVTNPNQNMVADLPGLPDVNVRSIERAVLGPVIDTEIPHPAMSAAQVEKLRDIQGQRLRQQFGPSPREAQLGLFAGGEQNNALHQAEAAKDAASAGRTVPPGRAPGAVGGAETPALQRAYERMLEEQASKGQKRPVEANPFSYRDRPFVPEGVELDISNLADRMGHQPESTSITLTLGEKPRVRVAKPTGVEEYEVPAGLADQLREASFQKERGKPVLNARARRVTTPTPKPTPPPWATVPEGPKPKPGLPSFAIDKGRPVGWAGPQSRAQRAQLIDALEKHRWDAQTMDELLGRVAQEMNMDVPGVQKLLRAGRITLRPTPWGKGSRITGKTGGMP